MIRLRFTDDHTYLVPGALAWLKETERILNDECERRREEIAAFGSVRIVEP